MNTMGPMVHGCQASTSGLHECVGPAEKRLRLMLMIPPLRLGRSVFCGRLVVMHCLPTWLVTERPSDLSTGTHTCGAPSPLRGRRFCAEAALPRTPPRNFRKLESHRRSTTRSGALGRVWGDDAEYGCLPVELPSMATGCPWSRRRVRARASPPRCCARAMCRRLWRCKGQCAGAWRRPF